MSMLPFASTNVCLRCGEPADRQAFQFTLAESIAYDEIVTGNLCAGCYDEVLAFLDEPTNRAAP